MYVDAEIAHITNKRRNENLIKRRMPIMNRNKIEIERRKMNEREKVNDDDDDEKSTLPKYHLRLSYTSIVNSSNSSNG